MTQVSLYVTRAWFAKRMVFAPNRAFEASFVKTRLLLFILTKKLFLRFGVFKPSVDDQTDE